MRQTELIQVNSIQIDLATLSNLNKVCILSKVQKLTSDNEFLARIFDCWGAGKMFLFCNWISICRNRTCKNFENRSKTNVFMAKIIF